MLCTTPSATSCSMAAYRSSVISRITSMSTPVKRAGRPGRFLSGRTVANSPSTQRSWTLKLLTGFAPGSKGAGSNLVFRARPVSRTERSISSGSAALLRRPAGQVGVPVEGHPGGADDVLHGRHLVQPAAAALDESHAQGHSGLTGWR